MVLHYNSKEKRWIALLFAGAFVVFAWTAIAAQDASNVWSPMTWGILTLTSFVGVGWFIWVFVIAKERR